MLHFIRVYTVCKDKKRSSDKSIQYFFKKYHSPTPLECTMDYPNYIVLNQKEYSISMQRVNINITIILGTHEKWTLFICTKTFFVYRAIVHDFVVACGLFQNIFFQRFFSGTQSERQTVWIQIRTTFFLSESGSKQFAKSRLARKGGKPA